MDMCVSENIFLQQRMTWSWSDTHLFLNNTYAVDANDDDCDVDDDDDDAFVLRKRYSVFVYLFSAFA